MNSLHQLVGRDIRMNGSKLEAALLWAQRGFPVFPIEGGGKKPLCGSRGFYDATTDPRCIRKMFTDPVTGADLDLNVGCRPPPGIIVLDLDCKNGVDGAANYAALGGDIDGLVVETPSGGRHVYLHGSGVRQCAGVVAPGIDIRTEDGYALAPGSIIDGKSYTLISDGDLLDAPSFLVERAPIRTATIISTRVWVEPDLPRNTTRATEYAKASDPATTGTWHSEGFKLGAQLCRFGLSPEAAVNLAAEHWLPRGYGFKSQDQFESDILGGYHTAEKAGEHGVDSIPDAEEVFAGVQPPPVDEAFQAAEARTCTWIWCRPTELQGKSLPDRQWIVPGWLSPGHTTLLYADGGIGKSLLGMQLMSSAATGRPWLGMDIEPCRAIGLFCEDEEGELHRRQAAINAAYGVSFADLGDMRWASGVGADNALVEFDREGRGSPTKPFREFSEAAADFRARLILVDTAADTFDGDENQRRQVRRFVGGLLGGLAHKHSAAVLLNIHPSRDGLKSGNLDGGSTAWNNSARARWSLSRLPGANGEADPDARVLTLRKANYGSVGTTALMRWQRGVFVQVAPLTPSERMSRQTEAETVFLRLVLWCEKNGRNVSDSVHSRNYAPKVFATFPDRGGMLRDDFAGAMNRLFQAERISLLAYGKDRARKIVLSSSSGIKVDT